MKATTTMKLETTRAQEYATQDITRLANGYTAQASLIFGNRADEQGPKLLADLLEAAEHFFEHLERNVAKCETAAEAAERFNSLADYVRQAGYFEFRQAFSIEASVYIKCRATARAEKRGSMTLTISLTAEVNAPATSRDVASAVAFGNLYQQAVQLAALIEGTGTLFTRMSIITE